MKERIIRDAFVVFVLENFMHGLAPLLLIGHLIFDAKVRSFVAVYYYYYFKEKEKKETVFVHAADSHVRSLFNSRNCFLNHY